MLAMSLALVSVSMRIYIAKGNSSSARSTTSAANEDQSQRRWPRGMADRRCATTCLSGRLRPTNADPGEMAPARCKACIEGLS